MSLAIDPLLLVAYLNAKAQRARLPSSALPEDEEPPPPRCFFCGGVWHPATGAYYSERVQACGPCVRHFWKWARHQQARWSKPGKPSFYEAATKWSA